MIKQHQLQLHTPSNDKTAPKSTKAQDNQTDKHPNQQDTHQPAHQIIDAKQDDTVRQSEQKPQVGDLSKHIDGQNSPEKPTDKNTDNKQLIKDALQAPKHVRLQMQQQMLKDSTN